MQVEVLDEVGYELALRGLSYSFKDRAIPVDEWWTPERFEKMKRTALSLAHRGLGHSKFLESIIVYLDIEAPRYVWSELDTYRVGTTKQSESTMHTLTKRDMIIGDVEVPLIGADWRFSQITAFNKARQQSTAIDLLKSLLPEGYLQRRLMVTNYMVLRNIINQRHDHRLPQWQQFCDAIYNQVKHPEFLPGK